MEMLIEQTHDSNLDLVRAKSTILSPSANGSSKNKIENCHEQGPEIPVEDDNDPKKKKSSSKTGKKGRRESLTKGTPKGRRKALTGGDGVDSGGLRGGSEHIRRTEPRPSKRRQPRRQSMSCIDDKAKYNYQLSVDTKYSDDSGPNPSDGNSCYSTDNQSEQSQNNTMSRPSSQSSLNSGPSLNRPPSNRSFDSVQSPKKPSSNRSSDTIQSPRTHNSNRPPSSRSLGSLGSDQKSLTNLSSHGSNIGLEKHFENSEFASDIEDEDETMCSVENIHLVKQHAVKNVESAVPPATSTEQDSARGSQRSREEKKTSSRRDSDAKPRKSRQPQLTQTDELGRGSNHYKLEGVYVNQKKDSKVKKPVDNEPEEEKDIQVLTKPPTENGRDTRNKTPIKGRFRTRRRGSFGADEVARTRSRSKEQPMAPKDFTRMRNGRSLDRLGRGSSHGKSKKKGGSADIISPESNQAVKKLFGPQNPLTDDDTIVAKNTGSESRPSGSSCMKNIEERPLEDIENTASKDEPSSTSSANATPDNPTKTNKARKKTESSSKDLEKKQNRRSSTSKSNRKDRAPTDSKDVVKELMMLGIPLSEDDISVTKGTDEDLAETENTAAESRPSSTSSLKDNLSETKPSSSGSLNDTEKSLSNHEKVGRKTEASNEDLEKKQRRRSSTTTKKDKASTRLSGKSSHKLSRKSTRGDKKSRSNPQSDSNKKNDNDLNSTELTISSSVEDLVSESEVELNEISNHEAKDSAKTRSSAEKTSKKDRTSSRRSSVKATKKNEKGPSPTEANHQVDLGGKSDLNSPSDTENNPECEEINAGTFVDEFGNPISLDDLFDNTENDSEKDCKDTASFFSASRASDESEEKDNENPEDANYLQLTFLAENGADNLFALMDEKMNQSFQAEGKSEKGDRNFSLRSFVSFADEVDLKVSTTSFSLSNHEHDKGVNDVLVDNEVFLFDDDGFAREKSEELTAKQKKVLTPVSPKKKVSPFSMSKSSHEVGRYHDQAFAGAETPRRKRRDSMLKKMRTGITEVGRQSLHKAASTRNMLGQATTKVFARGSEEGRGLLRNDSD